MQQEYVTEDRLADVLEQILDRFDGMENRLDKQDEMLVEIRTILKRVDRRSVFVGQATEDLQSKRE